MRSSTMLVWMPVPSLPTVTINTPVSSGQMAENSRLAVLLVWPCMWIMAS